MKVSIAGSPAGPAGSAGSGAGAGATSFASRARAASRLRAAGNGPSARVRIWRAVSIRPASSRAVRTMA